MIDKQPTPNCTLQEVMPELNATWPVLVNELLHELTTPFIALQWAAETLEEALTQTLISHRLAKEQQLRIPDILETSLEAAEKVSQPPGITLKITRSLEFLSHAGDMIKQLTIPSESIPIRSIREIIKVALDRYPFSSEKEREAIHLNLNLDFNIQFPSIFMDPLISNLFSNALRTIKETGQGEITLWTEEKEKYYLLHIKDTAGAMDENVLPRIFHRYFSIRDNETKPGLGFCRFALLQRGGDILCDAVKEQYTDFVIKFPKEI